MIVRILIPITACLLTAQISYSAETLPELLARMDQAAGSFTGVTAHVKQVEHTEILGENETQTAIMKLKRTKKGLLARVDFDEPNRRVVGFRERTVQEFTPKSNTVQIIDLGKFGSQVDQFLLLGFGTSGKDLQKSYDVKLMGSDTIDGKPVTRIELVPKSKEALDMLKKAELWIAQDGTYPLQEKIYKKGQDYILFTYTDVKLNPSLTDKELQLTLPPGVKKIYPQK